jgi:hypothetical protein
MWVSGQGAGHKEGVKGKAKEVDMGGVSPFRSGDWITVR